MPRPLPPASAWERCDRWPTPGTFWREPLVTGDVASLLDKYSSLLDLIGQQGGATRDRGLRELAARWPGVLREGQLSSTSVLRHRQQVLAAELERLQGEPARPREVWRACGCAAVPLWAELHRLLADLARIRAARLGPSDLPSALDPEAQERWPCSHAWWSDHAWPLDVRVTRSWLAAVAGLEPAELDRLLRG